MSDDPLEYINSELNRFRHQHGREPSPREIGTEFLRLSPAQRSQALNQLDTKLKYADLSLDNATRLHSYRRALVNANEAARRVNR